MASDTPAEMPRHPAHDDCQRWMMTHKECWPRTCPRCKLGPCAYYITVPKAEPSDEALIVAAVELAAEYQAAKPENESAAFKARNFAIDALRARLAAKDEALAKSIKELADISAAIGTHEFMDPPDGGSVTLAEQVRRMRAALAECRAKVIEECAALFEADGDCTPYSRDGVAHMIRALAKEAPRG